MPKEEKKVSFKRLIYSLIDYVAYISVNNLNFDVSSYVYNADCRSSPFARSKISCRLKRHFQEKLFDNRFFITMSFNDNTDRKAASKILEKFAVEFKNGFNNSNCKKVLMDMGVEDCKIAFVEEHNFFAVIFDITDNSTIECIISTDTITSKLIQRDSENDVVDYNQTIYQNLKSFQKNIQW